MARERKPTAKQVFKQYLKAEKARSALLEQESLLRELIRKSNRIDDVIEHDGIVYKIYWSGFGYPQLNVDRLGSAERFASLFVTDK